MIRLKACLDIRRFRDTLSNATVLRPLHSHSSWRPILKPPRLRFAVGLESPEVIVRPRPTRSEAMSPAMQQRRKALTARMDALRDRNVYDAAASAALIQECLADNHIEEAAFILLHSTTEAGIVLPVDLYTTLLEVFSSHYLFDDACVVATKLVNAEVCVIDPSYIALALSGSMNTGSLKMCSDLLMAIVQHRRSDLLAAIGAVEVRLPSSSSKRPKSMRLDLSCCVEGFKVLTQALRDGWFSAPGYKMFISILLISKRRDIVQQLLSESIDCTVDSKLKLVPLLHAFADIAPPAELSSDKHAREEYGKLMSSIMNIMCRIVQQNSEQSRNADSQIVEADPLPLLRTPLEWEQFVKVFWKVAHRARQYDPAALDEHDSLIAADLSDFHQSLFDFSNAEALGANYSVPWGLRRRSFRALVDLLGFHQNVRDKEYAMDLLKVNVFKSGAPTRKNSAVKFAPLSSIVKSSRLRELNSPYKLLAPPPEWERLSGLLANSLKPETLMEMLASSLRGLQGEYANSVWALSILEQVLARREPEAIPPIVIEEILEMCISNRDFYSMLEVLFLVRERGIKLPEQVWSKIMHVTWHGGTRHMTVMARDRLFAQVIDLIKQCSGQLDGASVAVLMRYLFFKKDQSDNFLYKIVDRLYKDKTQNISFMECAVLCALIYKRNRFLGTNKYFELSRPLFATSKFVVASDAGEIKLYDALYDMVEFLPDGFFNRFADAWPSLRTKQGRIDFYMLSETLLYDEQVSFLITVPAHEQLRDILSVMSVYAAFLVCHNDKQHRKSYELLHRFSTLHRQYEDNKRKKRLYEYSCPRKYKYHEPFSHFSFGWIENDVDNTGEQSTDDAAAETPTSTSGESASFNSNSDWKSSAAANSRDVQGTGYGGADNSADAVMTVDELRRRAEQNVFKEKTRAFDLKNTNQHLKSSSSLLAVEKLRFIPERS